MADLRVHFIYLPMKSPVFSLVLALGALAFSGCESMKSASDGVRESWATRYEGHSQVFKGTQKEVYAACKGAVDAMGFRFIKGGAAQGKLEAVSTLRTDNNLKGSSQLSFKVTLRQVAEGVEVNLLILEVVEDNFNGRGGIATETPLRKSPLYELYMAQVGEVLSKQRGG